MRQGVAISSFQELDVQGVGAIMSLQETETNKIRVFVSSVMDGFTEYRDAARLAISAANAVPVLVEDFPSLSSSPRNACLDGVRSCDAIVLIIGSRGGWTTPSGSLVVEEELDEARKSGMHVFIFVEKTEHGEQAEELIQKVSEYVGGYFRTEFNTIENLSCDIKKAVQSIAITYCEDAMPPIHNYFKDIPRLGDEAAIRFVLASTRNEDAIDPAILDSKSFADDIFRIAHNREVALFSYEHGKRTEVHADDISFIQEAHQHRPPIDQVHLKIALSGTICIDV